MHLRRVQDRGRNSATMDVRPGDGTGRRGGLKIRCPQGHVGSNPTPGTSFGLRPHWASLLRKLGAVVVVRPPAALGEFGAETRGGGGRSASGRIGRVWCGNSGRWWSFGLGPHWASLVRKLGAVVVVRSRAALGEFGAQTRGGGGRSVSGRIGRVWCANSGRWWSFGLGPHWASLVRKLGAVVVVRSRASLGGVDGRWSNQPESETEN